MRITTSQLYDNLLQGVQQQLNIQNKGNAQITSGTRFQTPAEAALDYRTSLDIRHAQKSVDGGIEAIAIAESRLAVSQNHLNNMGNIFSRAQTLAVQQASGQISSIDRQAAISEITHLTTTMLNNANQKWQGQALFSGTAVDKVPFVTNAFNAGTAVFAAGANTSITNISQTANPSAVNDTYAVTLDAAGTSIASITNSLGTNLLAAPVPLVAGANAVTLSNSAELSITYNGTPDTVNQAGGSLTVSGATAAGSVSYAGSDQDRVVTVNPSLQITSNIRGDDPAFTAAFQALQDFKTALQTNNIQGVTASIGALTAAGEALIDITADVGARIDALQITKTSYEDMKSHFAIRLSTHEGVDIASVVTEMKLSEIALQASYSQISKLQNLSLINFLG
ncbi:flagellar hook-associated protein 3 FlgL [Mariprofundus micogutta]|uniref:Flagellar hook-associated protein 3 FlgL n=1 Tax=Mariprofundus micogutta TaxID=1921010 RepID=A0A1L8CKM1_9PROT|nr:flagellar hook-associated protein FlgL [Mariprofundus micogutta]GAV19435.1 flagellar hook-associated protein 3 FlgL [Mariprofundus micogutta]